MSGNVAILGGGVGGLSAAHELVERGFTVSVFERNNVFGGKARSIYVPDSGTGGHIDLPGEHGFRFFPAFYKHLPDTLMRIPFAGNVSVYNNLVHATRIEVAQAGQPPWSSPAGYRRIWRIGSSSLGNFSAASESPTTKCFSSPTVSSLSSPVALSAVNRSTSRYRGGHLLRRRATLQNIKHYWQKG